VVWVRGLLLLLLLLVVGLEVPGRAGGGLHLVRRVEGREVHLELVVVLPVWEQGHTVKQDPDPDRSGDGILGHQFGKRLKSFAPFYSQSLLLADFIENHTLLWF
jgi:hypothetical protein